MESDKVLNPKLWKDFQLKPEVEKALIKIRDKFVDGLNKLNIPAVVTDTWLVGSNASYNYSDSSDLDLHVIVDMENQGDKEKLLLLYNYYKSAFNDKYDIEIKGIPIELYIQPADSILQSAGIYSLDQKQWIQQPNIDAVKPNIDISTVFDYMVKQYQNILLLNSKDKAQSFLDTLHFNRARSLALDGEYGIDNLVFKAFRNNGYIQQLKDLIVNAESQDLSLEGLVERFGLEKSDSQ